MKKIIKDQVSVNQLLCIEREQAIAEREQTLAELRAENNTIPGWCDALVKFDEIIQSQRPKGVKNCIGFSRKRNDPQGARFMLKFGMFVSSIPDPNDSECSNSIHTEGTQLSTKKSDKSKAKVDYPSKTKTPKLKKNLKTLGSGPSVSGSKKKSKSNS